MSNNIADIRKTYALGSFNKTDANANPFEQFAIWWQQAVNSQIDEVNAITLATVDAFNKPHARTVLLKGFNSQGFNFYTNYHSNKGQQIAANPSGAIVLFWKELERQIRLEGTIIKLPQTESDTYFNSRPYGSKIGAVASPQSQVIPNRQWLETQEKTILATNTQATIKRPTNWGGYQLQPTSFEFWQGRPSRLHDRIVYTHTNNTWLISRLAP